uniref:Pre-mrna-splicing factor cwc2 n=1 Tax=Tetraselmis sp. GSL018 TaxID=582737 RepID=A0A061SK89_9CHLO
MSNFMQGNTAPNTLASEALKRPARRQPARPVYDSDTSDYNIWYHKKMGTREPRRGPRGSRAATKCVLATDAGYTRADRGGVRQFCIYFARGCCTLGERCLYLHRIPNEQDAAVLGRDLSQDCFGRTRAPDHKDDREGVGSMLRDCRTLFVFYGGAGGRSADDTRELVMDSFQEWGPIRSINVIPTKTIAFVQYYWRCSAEFAKEAMHAQCLKGSGSNEVLSVCWANDDPNPVAVRQVKREREHVFDTAVQNHVESLPEDQKRARLLQEQMAATGAYPDTDAMYGDGAPAAQAAPPHPSSWHAMAAAPTGGWAWAPARRSGGRPRSCRTTCRGTARTTRTMTRSPRWTRRRPAGARKRARGRGQMAPRAHVSRGRRSRRPGMPRFSSSQGTAAGTKGAIEAMRSVPGRPLQDPWPAAADADAA